MTVATQFSVTQQLTRPIANPQLPIDAPILREPQDIPSLGEVSLLSAVSAGDVNNPSLIPSVDVGDISAPSNHQPIIVSDISNPSLLTAVSVPDIFVPALRNAVSVSDVVAPSILSAVDSSDIANPTPKTPVTIDDIIAPFVLTAVGSGVIVTPSLLSAVSIGDISNPTAITPSVTDLTAPPFPLNHARILYDNQIFDYTTITADVGTGAENVAIPNTFQRWSFDASSDAELTITLPAVRDADTVCIGAHNLEGSTVQAFYSSATTGAFTAFDSSVTAGNEPIMFHISSEVSVRRLRIDITSSTANKFIGYVSAGIALQMQRPFFAGHSPINDSDATRYYMNQTESGEFIGQTIRSQGYQTSAEWSNIDDTWYRTYFEPFKQTAKTLPFFFAWNLLEYSGDVGLCFINSDIRAPYNGNTSRRDISMNLMGHGNVV